MNAWLHFLAHLTHSQLHALVAYLDALARHAHQAPRGVGSPVSCGPTGHGAGYQGPCGR